MRVVETLSYSHLQILRYKFDWVIFWSALFSLDRVINDMFTQGWMFQYAFYDYYVTLAHLIRKEVIRNNKEIPNN